MAINSKHEKVSGGTAGDTGTMKKDGYAGTHPPKFAVGTKVGKTAGKNARGYSGPPVAKGSF